MTARPVLTRRQREVLLLVANGHSNNRIAHQQGVTPNSVTEVLTAAYRRLGVADRAQAVAVGLRLGVIDMDDIRIPEALTAKAATP
ncbi:LuxR C-terminal-related transcriptional regulator [Streptomyces xanthophaeus]|uniref:LuxR C-terminal-related transcriptional regulator n=1 Tax=Streptomyces xanthophaeus TaxID=67385 RepID=UPI0036CE23D9